jgi:hypothetical protein
MKAWTHFRHNRVPWANEIANHAPQKSHSDRAREE